jgi:para-nitrobenzyl esterase
MIGILRRAALAACLALAAQSVAAKPASPAMSKPETRGPIVVAPAGAYMGSADGDVRVFKGIPYAAPPVGPLRWKPPQPLPPAKTGLKVTEFGPACMQPVARMNNIYAQDLGSQSEDCLSLNVWTPQRAKDAPVLVWIHGGALVAGSSKEALYDGAAMARRGLIVVSINYRLGVFGYLAHPELSAESPDGISGNYGLMDQIAALRWIRANIGAFGGDPARVTIAGESAGALSVMYLMASPEARGLFSGAIAQSAYMISTPELKRKAVGESSAEEAGLRLARTLQKPNIGLMRAMDARALADSAPAAGFSPFANVDGKYLTRQLVETFDRGEQARVPLMAGFNSGEVRSLTVLLPPAPGSPEAYERAIRERYGDLADAYLALYPSSDVREGMLANTRDALYGWTAERLARKQTAAGQAAFLYLFDHGYPATDEARLHAFHASELPYVFGTLERTPPLWPKIPATSGERALSDAMLDYWTSFARDGRPSAAAAPAWPAYGTEARYMHFAETPRAAEKLFPGMYALHEEAVCRRRAAGLAWNWNTGIASPELKPATCG